jgi:hypothetical protein
MKKLLWIVPLILTTTAANADLVFEFNSPAFSGNGYSTHVLTIEQLEQQRRDKIKADAQAEIDRAEREYRNTNAYKFQNNLESRIYAQLSKQIADALFGDGGTTTIGEWAEAQTPFGDNIRWMRDVDNRIYIEVYDSNGNLTSSFDVPVGEFAF